MVKHIKTLYGVATYMQVKSSNGCKDCQLQCDKKQGCKDSEGNSLCYKKIAYSRE